MRTDPLLTQTSINSIIFILWDKPLQYNFSGINFRSITLAAVLPVSIDLFTFNAQSNVAMHYGILYGAIFDVFFYILSIRDVMLPR